MTGFDLNVIDININLCIYILAVSIYGIWFYDKEDCQRIAELMKKWVFPSICKLAQLSLLSLGMILVLISILFNDSCSLTILLMILLGLVWEIITYT